MADASEVIALVGGTIIDGNGSTPIKDGVIVIAGKEITEVGDRLTQIPPGARKIAATGKFVIPGLMDGGVWLVDPVTPGTMIRCEGRYDKLAIEAAQLALRNGVTTVFDIYGPREYLGRAREAVNRGQVTAARIYCAGNVIGWGGPYSEDFRAHYRPAVGNVFASRIDSLWQENVGEELTWMSPEEVRLEVRKYAQSGVDYLNYTINVHRMNAFQHIVFSPRVQRVIVEEGRRAGLAVAGFFAASGEGVDLAIGAEVDFIAGVGLCVGRPLPEDTIEVIAKRQIPCGFEPKTNNALEWYRRRADAERSPAGGMSIMRRSFETIDHNQRALLEAGAVALMTTNSSLFDADTRNGVDFKEWNPPEENTYIIGEDHFNWLLAAGFRVKGPT